MADRSIFTFFRKSLGSKETIPMLNLDYSKSKDESKQVIEDFSKLDLDSENFETPGLNLTIHEKPQIPLIGIGGAGNRIVNKIANRVKSYGIDYPTLGIDCNINDLDKNKEISHHFHIPGEKTGTGQQYRKGATRFSNALDEAKNAVSSYLEDMELDYDHEIVFLIMGSGGTGIGAGIELAKMLVEMGKRPVPFLILPDKNEMTRIRFNAAVALYYFSYAPKDKCLNLTTILIDNGLFLDKNSRKYVTSVISSINERVSAVIGDLLATTELESHAYSADLNEFLEVFRDLKGVGLLFYAHSMDTTQHLVEFYEDVVDDSSSFSVDIYSSTRSYFYISSKENRISAEQYRNLLNQFQNSDMFNKLYEIPVDKDFYALRGIFTGISYTSQLENLLQMAEDARVTVLNQELESNTVKSNPKIDRMQGDEEIDVKTGQELVEERAEEYAKKRRGDLS